ncbi:ribosome biogenesis factor YjgA [Neisseriaceae bacterium ESL0693]|nr:ribosome biogenesis factor YjgA [Neisseriaceae bacterium ESL0693]
MKSATPPLSLPEDDAEWVSKTRKKKQMNELQALGFELTKLSVDTLKKIDLPEELLEAIRAYHKINSNSALKRQVQYIGRLMREIDPAPIMDYLATLKGENTAHNAYLQRLEQLRNRLIADDQALTVLISQQPHLDIAALRTLIRNARKEEAENKPPRAFRALFQLLKSQLNLTDTF